MNQETSLNKALKIFQDSPSRLASALNVKRQNVEHWVKTGVVPAERCPAIEQATGGLVRCEDLRPDVAWSVVRGAAAQPQAHTVPLQSAIQTVAEAQDAIKHVEAVAVAEIKHVADEILKEAEPWDGTTERRHDAAVWDGKTERRKLDAPIDRRVSAGSVARAEFVRSQQGV